MDCTNSKPSPFSYRYRKEKIGSFYLPYLIQGFRFRFSTFGDYRIYNLFRYACPSGTCAKYKHPCIGQGSLGGLQGRHESG